MQIIWLWKQNELNYFIKNKKYYKVKKKQQRTKTVNYWLRNKLIMYNNDPYLLGVLVNLLKMNTLPDHGAIFWETSW
jgi:hypothetical protein